MRNIVIYILVLCVPIICARFLCGGGQNELTVLNRTHTLISRGLAGVCIMTQHITNDLGTSIFTMLGGTGVAIFLILSGFGLNESFKKHGLEKYWKKRILSVFLVYALFELFMLPIRKDWNGIIPFLLDITCIKTKAWFLHYLLILYVCYWLINRFTHKREIKVVCWVIIAVLTLIFGSDLEREQAISFALGILMSEEKEKIIICLEKRNTMIMVTGLSFTVSFVFLFLKHMAFIRSLFGTVPYALIQIGIKVPLAIGITMLICMLPNFFISAPFRLLGKISFELYLVHLVLLRFFNVLTMTSSMFSNLAIIVWGSIFMAYVYNLLCSKIKNVIEGER